MKKCKAFRSLLLAIFIVNFCWVASLFSREAGVLNQNSINDVSVMDRDGEISLVFSGNFLALEPADVEFIQSEESNRFMIKIRGSLWDTSDVRTVTKRFEAGSPITSVDISNEISAETGLEGIYTVIFDVSAQQDFTPQVAEPITASAFSVILKGKSSSSVSSGSMAQERKRAAEMQMKIEEQKERAQMTAEESVEAILQQYKKPSIMQVSIFNASGYAKRAYGLSVYLGKLKKTHIEESLGMKMEIVNISNAPNMDHKHSTIYFRNNFLKPALFLAQLIKGDQRVMPLDNPESKLGVDIEIYLGRDYK